MIWVDKYIYNELSGELFQKSSGKGFALTGSKEYSFGPASGEGICKYSNIILYKCDGYCFIINLKSNENLY